MAESIRDIEPPLLLARGLLLAGFFVFLGIILPVVILNPAPGEPVPMEFGSGTEAYAYLKAVSCATTQPSGYGTDERQVSNAYFSQGPDEDIPDPARSSMLLVAWGQLLDHDKVKSTDDPEAPPTALPFSESINMTLHRVLSRQSPVNQCLEPHNNLSPMLDGSVVYGDYKDPTRLNTLLRETPTSCRLRYSTDHLPPTDPETGQFVCGDVRCGEHVLLTALHTVLLREHNRICDANPGMDFWHARAAVVSILQHITYQEWLPTLLGSQYGLMSKGKVPPQADGVVLTTDFAVGAFRFGHSMVSNRLGPWQLKDLFFNPDWVRTNGIRAILHHGTTTPAQKCDTKVVDTLRNILFGTHGMDLVTLNLFRGRELGVASYADIVSRYQTTSPNPTPPQGGKDLLLSLLSEPVVEGSPLPETIARVIAEQFVRIRDNDPEFYTLQSRRAKLGPALDAMVRSTNLKALIERNTQENDVVYPIKQNPFQV